MRVTIRGRGVTLDETVRRHAERRLRFALGRFGASVRAVTMRLDDVNGPRGGVDTRVRLVVGLAPRGEVILEDEDATLVPLLDRSADRIGRAVERRLDRLRDRPAGPRRLPAS